MEQMMVIVPVDRDVHETENIAGEFQGESGFNERVEIVMLRTRNSRTMIVMMMAMTPSLKASSRPLVMPAHLICEATP